MNRLSLATIVAPHDTDTFFHDYWPDRLLVVHGDPDRLAPLRDLPQLQSARALAAVHHESVLTYLSPDQAEAERRRGVRVRASEAVELYDRGARLEFNYIDRWIPRLCDQMRRLSRDLHMPPDRVTCSFFAMPPGQVVTPHFDTQPALCIQLQGTKVWRIGPRQSVPEPLHNGLLGERSTVIREYYDGPIDSRMPDDSIEVVMKPGSVVYLPRGLPHETRSIDHTLSVTLDINHRTWADLVVSGLRAQLARSEAWRRHALGIDGSAQQRQAALAELRRLLPTVGPALDQMLAEPSALLDRNAARYVPGPRHRYRRAPHVDVIVEAEPWQVVVEHPEHGRTEIEISEDLGHLSHWVAKQTADFLDSDAYVESHTAGAADLATLLSTLVELEALEAVPA